MAASWHVATKWRKQWRGINVRISNDGGRQLLAVMSMAWQRHGIGISINVA